MTENMSSTARERHLRYYLERVESETVAPSQIDMFYPQVESLWTYCQDYVVRIRLLNGLVDYFEKRGLSDVQGRWYLQVLNDAKDFVNQAAILNNIGRAMLASGQWLSARNFSQRALHLARQYSSQTAVANILVTIAKADEQLGNFSDSMTSYEEAILIQKNEEDMLAFAQTLQQASSTLLRLGKQQRAVDYLMEALSLQETHGDIVGQMTTLNSLGLSYNEIEEYEQALDYFQQGLHVLRSADDLPNLANCLQNIANTYAHLTQWTNAYLYFEKALTIYRSLNATPEIATLLHNIGSAYRKQGNYDYALSYLQQALEMRFELGHKAEISSTFHQISRLYAEQSNWTQAVQYAEQAAKNLEETNEMSSSNVKTWHALGVFYGKLSHWEKAASIFNKALPWSHLRDQATRGRILSNLGVAYANTQNWPAAQQALAEAIEIKEALEDEAGVAKAYSDMASIYYQLEDVDKAIDYYFYAYSSFLQVENSKDAALALQRIGIIYNELGDLESEQLALKKAIELDRNLGSF